MAFTTQRVTVNMNVIDWNVCAKEWSHLQGLRFHHLGPRPIVDILIGLDCVDLYYFIKDISGKPRQPTILLDSLHLDGPVWELLVVL